MVLCTLFPVSLSLGLAVGRAAFRHVDYSAVVFGTLQDGKRS